VADIDTALERQIFELPERSRLSRRPAPGRFLAIGFCSRLSFDSHPTFITSEPTAPLAHLPHPTPRWRAPTGRKRPAFISTGDRFAMTAPLKGCRVCDLTGEFGEEPE
jgi:hypothetical protein